MLNCNERTIRNMIQRGSIHAIKIDPSTKSVYQISMAEVRRLLELRKQAKPRRPR